jgi:ribonucleoside-diphosphate reductase alpha chain
MQSASLRDLAFSLGMTPGNTAITPALERASSAATAAFLQGFFDANGDVQGSQRKGVSVRLAHSDRARLEAVQRMLLRLGINCALYRQYASREPWELMVSDDHVAVFADRVGFTDTIKQAKLKALLSGYRRVLNTERFVATVESVDDVGVEAVFDVQVPGINTFDGNGLHAHNCGEQPLPEYGSCLLGSVNLTLFVQNPFTPHARFDWDAYREVVAIFTRMLDNVVEINGLPLESQRREILGKRRHGMGYLGLGSTLTLLNLKYGEPDSLAFTENVTKEMALTGWKVALELAKEKGPAPLLEQAFTITADMLRQRPDMVRDGYHEGDSIQGKVLHARYSRYMQRIATLDAQLVDDLADVGARFTHHTSIAPTGTIALSLANNASNGIEPSFAHHYFRNVIRPGKKSKEKVDVFSFELLAYRHLVDAHADANALPDMFITADTVTPKQHVDIQAAAQQWIDSSISKTANVPTDFPYADFKDIYVYAYDQGLKGCTTFRFNPAAFQGVLVKEQDLAATRYRFVLEDGSEVEAAGNEEIEYDGELHTAANLFDAIKEGYYGKF